MRRSRTSAGTRAGRISAANAYTRLGERFYANDSTVVMDFGDTRTLWRWERRPGPLQRPAYLYPYQMAEQLALDALEIDPGNMRASALLVRALLAQKVEADVLVADGGRPPRS